MKGIRGVFIPVFLLPFAAAVFFLPQQPCPAYETADHLPDVEVVDEVDIERFMGTWYLIAEIPNLFEWYCTSGQTADYTLNGDGSVAVRNECYTFFDTKAGVEARAVVADEQTPAKLKVSFVNFFGIWLFAGDYWIVELGDEYEYAVIGHPTRNYSWILSRTCVLSDELLAGIFDRLEDQLYDRDDFIMIDHSKSECPDR